MTVAELTKRVEALEKELEQLKTQVAKNGQAEPPKPTTGHQGVHWWLEEHGAGRFADDPVFDEIVRLGREYRDSLHPDFKKPAKTTKKPKKKNARS